MVCKHLGWIRSGKAGGEGWMKGRKIGGGEGEGVIKDHAEDLDKDHC